MNDKMELEDHLSEVSDFIDRWSRDLRESRDVIVRATPEAEELLSRAEVDELAERECSKTKCETEAFISVIDNLTNAVKQRCATIAEASGHSALADSIRAFEIQSVAP